MNKVVIQVGQTLLDAAIQHLGNESGVATLAALNSLDMTADVSPGTELELPDVVDKRAVKVLKDEGIIPATNYDESLEGIGSWGVETDFIVS